MKFNVNPGGQPVDRAAGPVATDRTAGLLDYFFARATDEEWIADLMGFDNQVGAEDRGLVEAVQRGRAGGARARRLSPHRAADRRLPALPRRRAAAVAREAQRPRAREDALLALVGLEHVGDEELGRRRGHRAVGVRRARASRRGRAPTQRTRTLADSGSPSTIR